HRQRLTQFDPPLVKGIDIPNCTLREDAVLIEGYHGAQRTRRELICQYEICGAVAFTDAKRSLEARRAFRRQLLRGLAECQCLGLGKEVSHEQIVLVRVGAKRPAESDEIAGNDLRALMDELIERVLPICPRFAPDDRPGLVVDMPPFKIDVLAIALHLQLLEVSG